MELGKVLAPLDATSGRSCSFIRGLYNEEAQKGNIHSSQTGNLLSGAPLASGGEIRSGTSIDQFLAQRYGHSTKVPSLVLGCEKSNPSVHKNYSMLYSSHISWSSPTTPTPLEIYPALAFDRLFKDDVQPRRQERARRGARAMPTTLRRDISRTDQRKLDEYLDSVRDVEQRIEQAGKKGELQGWRPTLDKPNIPRPADGIPQDIAEHMRLMCDILVLGFQTDTTRICTLKLNNDHSLAAVPQSRRGLHDPPPALAHRHRRQVFPEFAALRGAMYEESVRFFVDLFRRDGSVLDILDADHTFLNEPLARLYGIPGVNGPEWRRVDRVKSQGRGGVLGMAALLAKQSGASRTSPILRGNWLLEMLLGEKLPKPPKNVPQLPESELDTGGLTMRQITEKHRSQARAPAATTGSTRSASRWSGSTPSAAAARPTWRGEPSTPRSQFKDGTKFADIDGLREYLLTKRRDEFLRQFCRKLLGYSLGRSVQLSDSALLDEMRQMLTDRRPPRPGRDHHHRPEPAVPAPPGTRLAAGTAYRPPGRSKRRIDHDDTI